MLLALAQFKILIITSLLLFHSVYAETDIKTNKEYEEKICARLSKLHFPIKDLPKAKDYHELKDCSPRDLYFGINVPQDYVKARKCAFIPYLEASDGAGILEFSDILTMIYANGKKVKRNVDLASKIVCDTRSDTVVNSNISIKFLQNLKRSSHPNDFNVCSGGIGSINEIPDSNTSQSFASVCSNVDIDIRSSDATLLIKKITKKYTTAQKKELNLLLVKATDFFKRHVEEEAKISQFYPGTSSANNWDEIESYRNKSELKNSLINSIYLFEQGKFPDGSKHEYTKILADFNKQITAIKALYANNQSSSSKHPEIVNEATIQSENEIQAAWSNYFNQFIQFATMRYPRVPDYKWKLWLTKKRTAELKQYLSELELRLKVAHEIGA